MTLSYRHRAAHRLVDIVFALLHLRLEQPIENARFLWDRSTALGQDGKFVPGYPELLYRLANDLLVEPLGIDIGGIPGCEAYYSFNDSLQYIFYVSDLPLSQAAFNISIPWSSSITQVCQSLLPIPMAPKIGVETRSPEEPNWTYSTLVAFRLLCSEAGSDGAVISLGLDKVRLLGLSNVFPACK